MSVAREELSCYVPAFFKRHIERVGSAPMEFWSETVPAAVAFADITGFTALAQQLDAQGPDGAELLARLLNEFYGRLVDLIYDHGGDVIAYAGDAAIAVWPADHGDLADAVVRAAQCGLEIQKQLLNCAVSDEAWRDAPPVRLSAKIALGAGDVCLAQIGGVDDFWQPMMIGTPLDQINEAGGILRAGDVVLSREAWKLAGPNLRGKRLGNDCLRLQSIAEPQLPRPLDVPETESCCLAAIRSFVPPAVRKRMDEVDGDWLADVRVGSVVFVKLCGIDIAQPGAAKRLHQAMQSLQRVMLRYEGTLVHLIQDDKGIIAVCCFGIPPLMHEDDAVRAVAAAIGVQKEFTRLEIGSQIGIATGRVFSGPRGNDRRREYSITGVVANLAARLMNWAQEGILCDGDTQSAASRQATFETLTPMRLKGFAEPVAVYRPVELTRRTASLPSRIAGRAREMGQVAQLLEAAAGGRKQILVIEGEAGVGKSTLVGELCRQAVENEITVFTGSADAIETSTPYFAWRPIVAQLFGIRDDRSAVERGQRVVEELSFDPALVERAALLNSILDLRLEESQLVAQLAGRARADNLHDLLVRLLGRAADRRPLLILIEDVHWLDSTSWRLALSVAQHSAAVTLVLTTRPHLVAESHEYSRIRAEPTAEHLYLDTLGRDDTLALVRERLRVPTISDRLGKFVFERTQGNPFFVEELVGYLQESQLLDHHGDRCDLAATLVDDDRTSVPRSIRALITNRIDRLSIPEQLSAKTASVIGRSFLETTVVSVYPNDRHRDRVCGHLEEFNRQNLTQLETPTPRRGYAFKHITIQQVTYEQIPHANRTSLHRAIANWYEKTEGDVPSNLPLLAYHFGRGGVPYKEIEYLVKSGEQALREYANREAKQAFAAAIEQSDALREDLADPEVRRRRGHWHRQLSEAEFHLGDIPAAQSQLERALELFRKPRRGGLFWSRLHMVGQLVRQAAHRTLPWLTVKRSLVAADAVRSGGEHEIALALQRMSEIHYLKVDIEDGLSTALESLNVAERAGRSPSLARAYAGMAVVFGLLSRRMLTEHYAHLAEVVIRDIDDAPTTTYVLMAISVPRLGTARWDVIRRHAEEAIDVAEQLQDHQQLVLSLTVMAMLECFLGEYDAVLKIQDQVRDAALISKNEVHLAWSHSARGEALFRLGETARAIDELRQAEQLLEGKQHSTEEIRMAGLLAAAYWRAGDREAAIEAVHLALKRIDECSYATVSTLEAFAGVVEVMLLDWEARGTSGPLEELLPRAIAKFHWYAKVFPVGRPRWLCHRGTMHWLAGQPRKAARDWARSLREAEKMEMPLEQGFAHYEIGRHADKDSPERTKHLTLALEIFEQLGIMHELNLAKRAL